MGRMSSTYVTQDAGDEQWLDDAFVRFAESRDPALREEIVHKTMWLAVRGARRFASRGEPFDDLLQVARIGLLKAIDRFDPGVGVQFGAYATPTIMGELRRHFRDHTWSVHVPRRAKDLRPAVNDATDQLSKELGRAPQVSEIAQQLEISEDAVLEAMEANNAYRASTLDPNGTGATLSTNADFNQVIDRQLVAHLLDRLRPRERTILYLRFYEELSQAQIAARIGTSQVHVGRLLAASLESLRTLLAEESVGND
jgi:RNA polymerase sigma-B factor